MIFLFFTVFIWIRTARAVGYLVGNVVLALGLTLNTQTQLGVSPIMSIVYSTSELFGMNFGNTVFAMLGVGRVITAYNALL